MNFSISWILSLFRKPEVEVTFDKANIKVKPSPAPARKKRVTVPKATTRKPAAKKTVAKKTVKKKVK
jgi:hypothetical protein